ncbi:MAG TPA: ABC transporter substrate-binding protein [Saprospiraceae bacterium]|nr:ABC transporter substrate-binding protein [Saprospiraceae bacterium]HPN70754.1 ABC transporter substrate-binding protein [Saprospiraceae bacterium]
MKVGILSPSSATYPLIAFEFMDGLKTYLKNQGQLSGVEMVNDSVGYGGQEKEIYTKAEKLLMIDDIDVLLAFIDLKVLDILTPLIYASGKLMIVINPGANYPTNWVPAGNIIHLSLLDAFCCWMTAEYASRENEKSAIAASTFYDCGYLHSAAMSKCFWKNGGQIVYNYINNNRYDETFAITELANFISENKEVKNILCQFDAKPAHLLYSKLNELTDSEKLKLFVSPMMLQESVINSSVETAKFNISGHQVWSPNLSNDTNNLFHKVLQENGKKAPTIFTLLGWETAMILDQIMNIENISLNDGESIVNKLKSEKFNSPRGEMFLDTDTQFYISKPYYYEIMDGRINGRQEQEAYVLEQWQHFISEPTQGAITGWMNTYLCY